MICLAFADLWAQYSAVVGDGEVQRFIEFLHPSRENLPSQMGRKNDGFESGLSKYSLQADVETCLALRGTNPMGV